MRNIRGKNRFDRGKGSSSRRGNDSERPEMHKATCNNCGKDCEVPFKPTSGKPIYCSNCFDKEQNDNSGRYDRNRGDRGRSDRDRDDRNSRRRDFGKKSFGDRDSTMYNVVCDSCGKDCEVPFKPTSGKPIYCDNCFGSKKESGTDDLKKEIDTLNKKLDKILKILATEFEYEDYDDKTEKLQLERIPKKRMKLKKEK
jgi:CxxC-x17-CxxC domain-containing protein